MGGRLCVRKFSRWRGGGEDEWVAVVVGEKTVTIVVPVVVVVVVVMVMVLL